MSGEGRSLSCRLTKAFIAIIGMLVFSWVVYMGIGFYAVAYEDVIYAKKLDNPYVDSDFEGWHTEVTEYGSIILPAEWNLTLEDETMQIFQDGEMIGVGGLIGSSGSFMSKEEFLSQILNSDVSTIHCDLLHSLLHGNYGKLYINENRDLGGHYMSLSGDNGTMFFHFSPDKSSESELKSKVEAIIFDHVYR
ncbi:MAG: hypothetical protein IKM61_05340 [Eubacteriaceae bacterium]|nr:hypothetical protein [Eubacteriaceae bacterium]